MRVREITTKKTARKPFFLLQETISLMTNRC